MPIPALIAAGAATLPSIFGAIEGIGQRRQARRIRANAVDPGYEMNSGVLQNRDLLADRYGNYTMPGYSQQMANIGANAATAFDRGVQGASSGGDVLDLATKIAYGTGQQQNQLAIQNAQGKERAFADFLGANAAAGEERQAANEYDRQQYQAKLQEAAALYGAGGQNINNAITSAGSIGTSLLMSGALGGGKSATTAEVSPRNAAIPTAQTRSPFQQSVSQNLNPDVMNKFIAQSQGAYPGVTQSVSQALNGDVVNRFLPYARRTGYQSMPNLNPLIPFPTNGY